MYIRKRREWIKKALITMYIGNIQENEWLKKRWLLCTCIQRKKGVGKKGADYYWYKGNIREWVKKALITIGI